jgi:dTDP-4-amino-4,6-dideoxygalactose transaminase
MIYYPIPHHHQEAFRSMSRCSCDIEVTEKLCASLILLPVHKEKTIKVQGEFIKGAMEFFNKNL